MDVPEPAEPAGMRPGLPTPCERELEEKNAENAQLKKQVAELKKQVAELEAKLGPYPGPPAHPLRPYPPGGPWGKGLGGSGSGP
jgi:hypothetical protein